MTQKETTMAYGDCAVCDNAELEASKDDRPFDAAKASEHEGCTKDRMVVTYRSLRGREPLEIQEAASTLTQLPGMRNPELHVNTATMVWERLQRRVLLIDGKNPDWDEMEEPQLWALAAEFGSPGSHPN